MAEGGAVPAEKPRNRHASQLAANVPKRDVYRRDAIKQRTSSSEDVELLLNLQREWVDLCCVKANTERRDYGWQ